MMAEATLRHATASLLVVDAQTGKTVFSSNEQTGLAPASTLKVITAATAFEQLGPGYTFTTSVLYTGAVANGVLRGNLLIEGSGDPTLGSWRYAATKDWTQLRQLSTALYGLGVKKIIGNLQVNTGSFGTQMSPGGWTFDDMGNYYGAGAGGLNWYENQYDLLLRPGKKVGAPVEITGTRPIADALPLRNELSTGPAGSGDQAIIYPDMWPGGTVRGTVPAGVASFTISGSVAHPADYLHKGLQHWSRQQADSLFTQLSLQPYSPQAGAQPLLTWRSPGLDSIAYFFLQKSINLYGEALLKQMALRQKKAATTDEGVELMRSHWMERGISRGALRMVDGSGLSPHNRITTRALVDVLQYARSQSWYKPFYEGLPTINGIKMKSGSIKGVRGYAGYVTSARGTTYTFAFLVNNFEGSSAAVMQKMFTVLNTLK